MIKEIDFEIDHLRLVDTFNKLDLITLLKSNLNQIAVQHRGVSSELQLTESCQSLVYDWTSYNPNIHSSPPKRETILNERDFNISCDLFKGTYIEEITQTLHKNFGAYRGRLMLMRYKTCLSMHMDHTPRLHIPIITNPDAFMVIQDTTYRFPFGKLYIADTRLPHTAVNAGKKDRVHMVFCVDEF